MGLRVIAVGRGGDIAGDALALGAHIYLDSQRGDVAAKLKELGGTAAIISTIGQADAVAALMPGLAPHGQLILLGAGKDPLPVSMGPMVVGERGVRGSLTGSPFENERALDFSVLAGVRPLFETMPLERANEAYQRMRSGDAKFRMVLTMRGTSNADQ